MKRLHAFLIPLHNEELVLTKTIQSLLDAGVSWEDMYFVDDGSTDRTFEILNKVTFPYLSINNMLYLNPNVGKTQALITAFKYFNLVEKYEFLNTLDGDTLLAKDYMQKLIPILNDASKSTAAIASRVCSVETSWNPCVVYRIFEYWLMQNAYKKSQGYINCITVLPGCGTTFRSSIFEELSKEVDRSLLTEDFDFTVRIHLKDMGKILYRHDLRVITQDPMSVLDYKKQSKRWFEGAFQVYLKRKMWQIPKNKINAETSFLLGEGLFFSALFIFAIATLFFHIFPFFTHYFFKWDFIIFTVLTLIAALFECNLKLILYMPFFYFLRIVKCLVYVWGFIRIVIFKSDKKKGLLWNKVERY